MPDGGVVCEDDLEDRNRYVEDRLGSGGGSGQVRAPVLPDPKCTVFPLTFQMPPMESDDSILKDILSTKRKGRPSHEARIYGGYGGPQ